MLKRHGVLHDILHFGQDYIQIIHVCNFTFEVELNKNCSVISQNVKLHVVYLFLKCKIIWSTP